MVNYKKVTGKNCQACKLLDNYLKGKGIEAVSYDIDSLEGSLLAEDCCAMSIPIFIRDDDSGRRYVVGFNKIEINKLINSSED